MSPSLQAVLPGASVPGYSSVRQIRVWGATGVSEPSLNWARETLNKKERQLKKKNKKDRKEKKELERTRKNQKIKIEIEVDGHHGAQELD